MRERGETLTSIVAKEQLKRKVPETAGPPSNRNRTILIAASAFFLIVLGIASVSAAIFFRQNTHAPTVTSSIIFPNKTASVDVVQGPLSKSLAGFRQNATLVLGEVEKITVLQNGVPMAPQDLATALGAPPALAREVTDAMVGIHAFDRSQPFIIFKVAAYDRAFSAILVWEPDMARSLGEFFAPLGVTSAAPALTFKDAVVQNLDVRESQSSWPVLYTFPTQGLFVITTNEYTLREVMTRLGTR
jgi:hypothetical protein